MDNSHLHSTDKKWFAICTKYKCEKYVAKNLASKGVDCYLPLISKVKVYASRKKEYRIPLINCYVFVYINKDDYIKVLETEYVFSFLKQGKELISIPEAEIEILKRVVGETGDIAVRNEIISEGDEVEIISGNLTGIKGRIVEEKGKNSVTIDLTSVGMQMVLAIDKRNLRLLRSHSKLMA